MSSPAVPARGRTVGTGRAGGVRTVLPDLTWLPWLLVCLGMAVATWSVVQYRFRIVAAYVLLVVLLAAWVLPRAVSREGAEARRPAVPTALAGVLVVVAGLHLWIRPYTYLTPSQGWTVRCTLAAGAVLAALALLPGARRALRLPWWAPLAPAALAYVVAAVLLIHWDPTPKIDVWVTLQQAADGILDGKNMYSQNWTGSPGVQDAFTYLPFTGLLLAPGRWFAGDVRWMLVVVTLLGVLAVALLGRRTSAAAAAGALLLLLPGTPTQIEQAWTEPLLMACLAGWALGVQRRIPWWSVLCLALGLAAKQHLVLLLPMLAAWPRFGWRRTLAATVLAGIFMLPWFLTAPADFLHDTVTVLIDFQPLVFADTLFIAAVNDLGWTPPFWLTGLAVVGTVVAGAVLVHRRNPDLAAVLRWAALMLFVANLVNKQAFYNQYWLVAALVVLSLAVPTPLSRALAPPPTAGAAA